jgi:hypothetical protein
MPKQLSAYDFAASGPRTGAWVICPPCQARYTGLPPPAPVLSGGSRIADRSSPGHAHRSTICARRHLPCAYIMKREPYPRRKKPWFYARPTCFPPPCGEGLGVGAVRGATTHANPVVNLSNHALLIAAVLRQAQGEVERAASTVSFTALGAGSSLRSAGVTPKQTRPARTDICASRIRTSRTWSRPARAGRPALPRRSASGTSRCARASSGRLP